MLATVLAKQVTGPASRSSARIRLGSEGGGASAGSILRTRLAPSAAWPATTRPATMPVTSPAPMPATPAASIDSTIARMPMKAPNRARGPTTSTAAMPIPAGGKMVVIWLESAVVATAAIPVAQQASAVSRIDFIGRGLPRALASVSCEGQDPPRGATIGGHASPGGAWPLSPPPPPAPAPGRAGERSPARCCLSLSSSAINCCFSAGARPAINSTTQASCWRAMRRKWRRPPAVRWTVNARRSRGSSRRSTWPSSASRSVRPVTLPPVTIRRRESSRILRPWGQRSSWAMRSKRASDSSHSRRRRLRSRPSMRLVQVSMRNHRRTASWSSSPNRDSRSGGPDGTVARMSPGLPGIRFPAAFSALSMRRF